MNVSNTGDVDSAYVVLGFLSPPGAGTGGLPLQELFGFERVFLRAGESVRVWLGLSARDVTAVVEEGGGRAARLPLSGAWRMRIGAEGEAAAVGMEVRVE